MTVDLIKQTSRSRYLHTVAKLAAKENHQAQLLLTRSGGTFRVTPELISFLSVKQLGKNVVIVDIYDNPISVDRESLLSDALAQYKLVMESWESTVNTINNQR